MKISYSKRERFEQIEAYLQMHEKATMTRIARHLKMSPNGHMMALLWEMSDAGIIQGEPRAHRPGWVSWEFRLVRYEPLNLGKKKARK
jgi:hypothetical protein